MRINRAWLSQPQAKVILFLTCILPFGWLVWGAFTNALGANPTEYITRFTGDWTLRMLGLVLMVTPLRVLSHTPQLARFRRMLGLFVYFYALLHLLAYAWFDMGLVLANVIQDIAKRPFILVGFLAVALLTPLALTSMNSAVKWLGGKRWRRLHQLVYPIAILGIVHFFWMRSGKQDFAQVYGYATIVAALLGWRLWHRLHKGFVHRRLSLQPCADFGDSGWRGHIQVMGGGDQPPSVKPPACRPSPPADAAPPKAAQASQDWAGL